MVRSSLEHRLGIEDFRILGLLGESDTGACQHKDRSKQAGYGEALSHTFPLPKELGNVNAAANRGRNEAVILAERDQRVKGAGCQGAGCLLLYLILRESGSQLQE